MTNLGDKSFRYVREGDISDRQGLEWYLDGLELDIGNSGISSVTSTTRPSFPADGKFIYETDTGKVYVYDGTAWVEVIDEDLRYIVCTSSTRPTNIAEGTMIWETDQDRLFIYDGTEWTPPKNLPWGTKATGAGLYTLTAGNTGTWTESVTLRSDRKYMINGTIGGIIQDAVGASDGTRMQMTAQYNAVTFDQSRVWIEEWKGTSASTLTNTDFVTNKYNSWAVPVNGLVTGTGSAANITFSWADSLARGYDLDVYSSYSRFIITDVGEA